MRTSPSPFMTILLVFGILIVVVAPPVGALLLIAAFIVQRAHTSKIKGVHTRALARAQAKHDREVAQALRYFG